MSKVNDIVSLFSLPWTFLIPGQVLMVLSPVFPSLFRFSSWPALLAIFARALVTFPLLSLLSPIVVAFTGISSILAHTPEGVWPSPDLLSPPNLSSLSKGNDALPMSHQSPYPNDIWAFFVYHCLLFIYRAGLCAQRNAPKHNLIQPHNSKLVTVFLTAVARAITLAIYLLESQLVLHSCLSRTLAGTLARRSAQPSQTPAYFWPSLVWDIHD